MANILLPIVSTWLALGKTIDITTYKFGGYGSDNTNSIFNDTDFVENRVDVLNSTYYVLPDEKLPFSTMGIPVDLLLRMNYYDYDYSTFGMPRKINFRGYDSAVLFIVTDYRTVDKSLKENAVPIPNWQNTIPKNHSHYVQKMHYGGRSIALVELTSNVTGDVQVFRRILRDVMGASGQVGNGILDLWNKAFQAIKDSPDVRGYVYTPGFSMESSGIVFPQEAYFSFDTMLEYLPDAAKYVSPYDNKTRQIPHSVSYRSLHDLDEQFPALRKNPKTELYLKKLNNMLEDLNYAKKKIYPLTENVPRDDNHRVAEFEKKVKNTRKSMVALTSHVSLYKDLNFTAFENAFKEYDSTLDNTTENYYVALRKLAEDIGVTCQNKFMNPTRGFLRVKEDEVIKKGLVEGGLVECQEICEKDKRCRAVGYADVITSRAELFSGKGKQCWIYYRSTGTATIYNPRGFSGDMKIYDRFCK